uniref:Parathyroid hormone n=1 Tax=Gouania willdenowi TaxID=441366 RepID=A0A8C5GWK2_GOUWI
MILLRHLEMLALLILLVSFQTEARPLRKRKRTISEVQLMHNVREHKQVGERQEWLQKKLKDIIVTNSKSQNGQSENDKYLFPNEVFGANTPKG